MMTSSFPQCLIWLSSTNLHFTTRRDFFVASVLARVSEWVRILSANNLNIWICRLDCNKYRQLKKYFAIATQNWIGKCLHSQLVRLLRRGWNNLICFNQNFPQRKIKFSLSLLCCVGRAQLWSNLQMKVNDCVVSDVINLICRLFWLTLSIMLKLCSLKCG